MQKRSIFDVRSPINHERPHSIKSNNQKYQHVSSSSREKLIETREKELNKLQIVLSLKRLREYQLKAKNKKYTSFNRTAANSIINLEYDYSDVVEIKRRVWEKYFDKNISPSFTLEPATGTDVIIDHIKNISLNHQISKEDYIDYCTTIVPLAKTADELKVFRIYGHLGDTRNSACKGPVTDQDERGAYKVDLRLVLESSPSKSPSLIKSYDVANCEGRKRLKALLVQVRYDKDQYGYTAQTVGKIIMFPTSQKYLGNFFDVELSWLMYWKERAEKNLNILKKWYD
ncbi:hypothetical protein EDC94DRAFT_589452 [Helicostylum pulchrum]|nr:hypothetical protein EDC94DRAFT_589452 [Helicostylum pulchrum]